MRVLAAKNTLGILPIAQAWQGEANNDLGIEMDVAAHLKDLQKLIDGDSSDLLVLYNPEPIGYMGMTVFTSPLSNQRIANEHYWYVLPERRGLSSLRLIKAAEKWAKGKNCTHLLMNASNLASDLHDKVCKIYERFDMVKFETTYIKEVQNGVL